jgi:hypothetical protein
MLEQLVAAIEASIGHRDDIVVEAPKYLPDTNTGKPREFDVVVTIRRSHYELSIAIECRDRTREVGVPDIEQFIMKCENARVRNRVIVSSSGFHKTALETARAHQVRCLTLDEVAAFDWCLTSTVSVSHHHVRKRELLVISTELPDPNSRIHIHTESGIRPVTDEDVSGWAFEHLNTQREPDVVGHAGQVRETIVQVDPSKLSVVRPDGVSLQVLQASLRFEFEVIAAEVPLAFHEYSDVEKGSVLSRAAVVRIDLGSKEAKLFVVQDAEGDTRLTLKIEGEPGKK